MRSYLPDFNVINPKSLSEALEAMASEENIVPLAGGTDLMVYMESGSLSPCTFLNLHTIAEFQKPPSLNRTLVLGPLSSFRHTRMIPAVRAAFPLLATAAREVGVLAIQSRGTWVGNIANGSPAADGVPALMAYDAEVELSDKSGQRRVPLTEFYTGYKQTVRRREELITAIHLPRPGRDWFEYYRKVGTRRFQAISKTLLAARIQLVEGQTIQDVRMVFASVGPYTLRARNTEEILRGSTLTAELIHATAKAIQDEIKPIDDIRSNSKYRRQVSANLIRDLLSSCSSADRRAS